MMGAHMTGTDDGNTHRRTVVRWEVWLHAITIGAHTAKDIGVWGSLLADDEETESYLDEPLRPTSRRTGRSSETTIHFCSGPGTPTSSRRHYVARSTTRMSDGRRSPGWSRDCLLFTVENVVARLEELINAADRARN